MFILQFVTKILPTFPILLTECWSLCETVCGTSCIPRTTGK